MKTVTVGTPPLLAPASKPPTQILPFFLTQFVVVLAVVAAVASATKVDTTYEHADVDYHYQPQQGHHQQLHTVVAAAEEQPHYVQRQASHYHQASHQQHHQIEEHHVEEKKQYKHIPIVKSESSTGKDGSYKYAYETANGIHQQEHGYVKNAGQKDHEIQVAEGFYSYTDEHGHQVGVHYIADENGFRAVGDHLPTPPPMPEALKEAYAKVAAHPELYQEEEHEQEQHHQYRAHHEQAAPEEPKYKYVEEPKYKHVEEPKYKHVEEQPQQSYEHVAYQPAVAHAPAQQQQHYQHTPEYAQAEEHYRHH